jgi:hypothetical protein
MPRTTKTNGAPCHRNAAEGFVSAVESKPNLILDQESCPDLWAGARALHPSFDEEVAS